MHPTTAATTRRLSECERNTVTAEVAGEASACIFARAAFSCGRSAAYAKAMAGALTDFSSARRSIAPSCSCNSEGRLATMSRVSEATASFLRLEREAM